MNTNIIFVNQHCPQLNFSTLCGKLIPVGSVLILFCSRQQSSRVFRKKHMHRLEFEEFTKISDWKLGIEQHFEHWRLTTIGIVPCRAARNRTAPQEDHYLRSWENRNKSIFVFKYIYIFVGDFDFTRPHIGGEIGLGSVVVNTRTRFLFGCHPYIFPKEYGCFLDQATAKEPQEPEQQMYLFTQHLQELVVSWLALENCRRFVCLSGLIRVNIGHHARDVCSDAKRVPAQRQRKRTDPSLSTIVEGNRTIEKHHYGK